jgi:hypothetical protein
MLPLAPIIRFSTRSHKFLPTTANCVLTFNISGQIFLEKMYQARFTSPLMHGHLKSFQDRSTLCLYEDGILWSNGYMVLRIEGPYIC